MTLAGFLIVLLTGSRVPAVHAQPAPPKLIVIHQAFPSTNAVFWPNYVATSLGYYTREGLDVEPVLADPNVLVATLIGGSVEIANADSTQLMLALDKGANLAAVGIGAERQPYKFMVAPGIKSFADLKGKKVGAAAEIDIYTYVLKQIMLKAKFNPDDVQWVYGGGQNQRLSAIVGGAIQGGLFSPPGDARLKDLGYNTLAFTPDFYPNLTLSVTSVRRDWAQQNAGTLRRLLRAQSDAVKWLNNPANHQQAIDILVAATKAKPSDAEGAYDYYIRQHLWTDACVHRPGLVNVVNIMHITGQLHTITAADVPKFADTQWCPK